MPSWKTNILTHTRPDINFAVTGESISAQTLNLQDPCLLPPSSPLLPPSSPLLHHPPRITQASPTNFIFLSMEIASCKVN